MCGLCFFIFFLVLCVCVGQSCAGDDCMSAGGGRCVTCLFVVLGEG